MANAQATLSVVDLEPVQVRDWLARGDTVLVDVREPFEHAAERIEGAQPHPLSAFDAEALRRTSQGKRVVFQCRTGRRSLDAANRFRGTANDELYHMAGGIEAWKAAGLPVKKSAGAPKIDVMRQVQMTAGALVVLGVALGWLVSPWFLIVSAFVGTGLVFAGASGWCGMAKLLALMPWNRVSA